MGNRHQTLKTRHLLGSEDLSKPDIETILDTALAYVKTGLRAGSDGGFKKLVCAQLFLEPSTRTRVSFEMACHRLGIKPLGFDAASSSLQKNESLLDTFMTVAALSPDIMVIRSSEDGFCAKAADLVDFPLINAGEGISSHPTQGLLDALTILRAKKTIKGLKVAICGDISHSRVAMTNFHILPLLGANVFAFGPNMFMPKALPAGVNRVGSFEEALDSADVVMMLRIQFERLETKPVVADYFESYGLTKEKLGLAKKDAIVMHPGPMNRGIEIASEVADDPKRSVILDQVANGLAVRMAVLDLLTSPLRKA